MEKIELTVGAKGKGSTSGTLTLTHPGPSNQARTFGGGGNTVKKGGKQQTSVCGLVSDEGGVLLGDLERHSPEHQTDLEFESYSPGGWGFYRGVLSESEKTSGGYVVQRNSREVLENVIKKKNGQTRPDETRPSPAGGGTRLNSAGHNVGLRDWQPGTTFGRSYCISLMKGVS